MWFWILLGVGSTNLCLGNAIIGGVLISMAFGTKCFSDGSKSQDDE